MELCDWGNIRNHTLTSRDNWNRIKNDDPSLTSLAVHVRRFPIIEDSEIGELGRGRIIEDAKIGELGRDIANNNHLRKLGLNGKFVEGDIDEVGRKCRLLCEGINENRSIKRLELFETHQLSGEMIQLVSPFLESNSNLQHMYLSNCELEHEEIRWLATSLARREIPLDELRLSRSWMDDHSVRELAAAFHDNPGLTPKRLDLNYNHIGRDGCESIANLLQDPRCTMEELILDYNYKINNDSVIVFTNALLGNATLNKLAILKTDITRTGLDSFLQLICDLSTINTTYTSNHTLHDIGCGGRRIEHMEQYLELNKNADKKHVAHRKVYMHHFSGNINMQPFEEMAPDLLVGSINFIDKWGGENDGASYDIARQSILFQLIKSDPMICKIEKSMPVEDGNPCKRRRV